MLGPEPRMALISLVHNPPDEGVPVDETEYSLRFGEENVVEGCVWGEELTEDVAAPFGAAGTFCRRRPPAP